MTTKYAIGVDFGTESGRSVLVQVQHGKEIASEVYEYSNGVMDEKLPSGVRLGHEWALQDPEDYIRTLEHTIPAVIKQSGISPADVIGIGIDFTACTMLPVDAQGKALCMTAELRDNPHAWVKLWKHHAAQPEADKLNETARRRGEDFLDRYGGKISSEWFFPKAWQILDEAPEIYDTADKLMEAADWVILQLTGNECRNSCTAGYKAIWEKATGFPSNEFFEALDPRLEKIVADKLSTHIYPLGAKAGGLTARMAKLTGLEEGTAVAVANVDAHVAVPATTVTGAGKMVMVMGTSICHMVCGSEKKIVPGMCGVVEDGILPGYFGFEAGQTAVGDIFAWFTKNCVPETYEAEAREKGVSVHDLLEQKASQYLPGETGVIALDWWNGNRSVLVDADLSGVVLGATLQTKPEDIYRAIIEATAFGTKKIIDTFEAHGVAVDEIYCCGGLPEHNQMLMQIYSDVTGRTMKISASAQTPALGSAMHGAVAAGAAAGGYDTIQDAANKMAHLRDEMYRPIKENTKTYGQVFEEYDALHDYFGRGANDVMKRLKRLKADQVAKRHK